MKQVIHRLFWAWDYDKEEAWINEMSMKGLALTDLSFCRYVFEDGTPGEYLYRYELLEHCRTHPESIKYLEFLEETGNEPVAFFFRWVILRRKNDGTGFDLFSDLDSRIRHLGRILALVCPISVLNICIGLSNLGIGLHNGISFNAWISPVNILLGLIGLYGSLRIYRKWRSLRRERDIHE